MFVSYFSSLIIRLLLLILSLVIRIFSFIACFSSPIVRLLSLAAYHWSAQVHRSSGAARLAPEGSDSQRDNREHEGLPTVSTLLQRVTVFCGVSS